MKTPTDISIERLLEQDIPELVGFNKDIVMISNFENMGLFAHPVRLKATTVLVCLKGMIDCSITLRNFHITENHMLVILAGDIIHIHHTEDMSGYAIMLSEDYLQMLQLDIRLRVQSYINLRNYGPINVPFEELTYLKPFYTGITNYKTKNAGICG